jgi:hypothetical protein
VQLDAIDDAKYPDLESAFVDVRVTKGNPERDGMSALKKYLHLMDEKMATAGILRFGRSLRSRTEPSAMPWLRFEHVAEELRSAIQPHHKDQRLPTIPEMAFRQAYMKFLLDGRPKDDRAVTN